MKQLTLNAPHKDICGKKHKEAGGKSTFIFLLHIDAPADKVCIQLCGVAETLCTLRDQEVPQGQHAPVLQAHASAQ